METGQSTLQPHTTINTSFTRFQIQTLRSLRATQTIDTAVPLTLHIRLSLHDSQSSPTLVSSSNVTNKYFKAYPGQQLLHILAEGNTLERSVNIVEMWVSTPAMLGNSDPRLGM